MITIRGLATKRLTEDNPAMLLLKESSVGSLNGVLWAVIVAAVTVLWVGDIKIAVVIAVAIIANLICAAGAGIMTRFC